MKKENRNWKVLMGVLLTAVFIAVSCESPEKPDTAKNKTKLELTESEAEYWKTLVLERYKRDGVFRAEESDKIILELRKRVSKNP
jgi:hypothetical protein